MKKAVGSLVLLFIVLWLFDSGIWEKVAHFFGWLFTLGMTQSEVSIAGELFVKIATFFITYALVGAIFNAIGWFNSGAMKIVYFIISTLISFALCYIIMIFETHLFWILIIVGMVLVGVIITLIICHRNR